MRKIVLTFGLIAGAMMSVIFCLQFYFHDAIGFDKGLIVGYTSMVLAFLMIWVGVKTYRDDVGGGTIGFGRAFAVGLLIALVASACYVATWQVIYYGGFAPDFMDKYGAYMVEQARAGGATEAAIAEITTQMAEMKEMLKNPLINIAFTLLEPLPVGLLMSLISAGVLSRKRKAVPA